MVCYGQTTRCIARRSRIGSTAFGVMLPITLRMLPVAFSIMGNMKMLSKETVTENFTLAMQRIALEIFIGSKTNKLVSERIDRAGNAEKSTGRS